MKYFHMPYNEKHRLRVRADFFDAFNHFNFDSQLQTRMVDTRDGERAINNAGHILGGEDS